MASVSSWNAALSVHEPSRGRFQTDWVTTAVKPCQWPEIGWPWPGGSPALIGGPRSTRVVPRGPVGAGRAAPRKSSASAGSTLSGASGDWLGHRPPPGVTISLQPQTRVHASPTSSADITGSWSRVLTAWSLTRIRTGPTALHRRVRIHRREASAAGRHGRRPHARRRRAGVAAGGTLITFKRSDKVKAARHVALGLDAVIRAGCPGRVGQCIGALSHTYVVLLPPETKPPKRDHRQRRGGTPGRVRRAENW